MFDDAGLPYTRELERVPNSRKSLTLAELARDSGRFAELHRPLFEAYWAEGRDIGDADVLADVAAGAGLAEGEVRRALAEERAMERITRSTAQAMELGAGGVPAWVIDERMMVPGAQPHDVFARVLERLGHAPLERTPEP